jgi:hypothetical protein
MSALLQKFEQYPLASSEKKKEIFKQLIDELKTLISETCDENTKPNIVQENLQTLIQAKNNFPNLVLQDYRKELFEFLINMSPDNIYKFFHDKGIKLANSENQNMEISSVEGWIHSLLLMIVKETTVKELYSCMKAYFDEKHKNKAQSNLVLIELLRYIIKNIDKKEVHLKEILPLLLKTLNPSLQKYIKYKMKVENNKYLETPKYVDIYLQNYEKWAKTLINGILEDLVQIINPKNEGRNLLFVKDLYENFSYQSDVKRKEPSTEKQISHYCILFIMDIFEGLVDARNNSYFEKENIDQFIQEILHTLLKIHPFLQDYLENFHMQLKMLEFDQKAYLANKRDEMNLPMGEYEKYTIYNYGSVAFLAVRFIQTPKESSLLKTEFKIKLVLPSFYQLFLSGREKKELKSEMLSTLQSLLKSYENESISINNLNVFGTSLDKVLEKVFDYCGGFVSDRDKSLGIEIYMSIKRVLSDKALAKLLILLISNSRYHSLLSFITSEFKTGLINALKSCSDITIKDCASPYLDLNLFRRFFEISANIHSKTYKHNAELTASFVNVLMAILMKYTNNLKNIAGYKTLVFKDPQNLFSYDNFQLILKMGEKVQECSEKITQDINNYQSQLKQMPTNPNSESNINNLNIQLNELLMVQDSMSRIKELYIELRSL